MSEILKVHEQVNTTLKHREFFQCDDRIVLFYGSAGSGKSFSICDKILIRTGTEEKLKIIVARKTLPSLRRTCIPLIEDRAKALGIPYRLNKSDFIADVNIDSQIYYLSMNHKEDYEKVKSITDVDMIWIEEATELSEQAFDILNLRLRGGQGNYRQLILSFNPIGTTSWIYDKFFIRNEQATKIQALIKDNPYADKEYVQILENLKNTNMNLYNVYCLGEWGSLKGQIYQYEITEKPPVYFDEIIYGLDFGFNHPTVLTRIFIVDEVNITLEQIIYKSGLTNNDLIAEMKRMDINKNHPIYADSAEPNRIEEIFRAGFNVHQADKDVSAGISFCQSRKIFITEDSSDLIKEFQSYVWAEDRNGKALDVPVKFCDDGADSARYGIFSHLGKRNEVKVRFV